MQVDTRDRCTATRCHLAQCQYGRPASPTTNIMHRLPPDSRLLTAKYDRQQQYCEKQTGTAHQGVRMTQILKLSSSLSQSLRFHCDSDRGHRLLKITKHLVVTNSGSNMSGDNSAKFCNFLTKT